MQRQTELDALGDTLKKTAQGVEGEILGVEVEHTPLEEKDKPPNRHKRRAAAAIARRKRKKVLKTAAQQPIR